MIDPVTASNDRLRDTHRTSRWGYTGEMLEDPLPMEESRGIGRGVLWALLLVIAAVIVIALFANPM